MLIRDERCDDAAAIAALVSEAFAASPHGDHGEARIVAGRRAVGALTLSLVADDGGSVGHAAFSRVTVARADCDWFGLGPVAVLPTRQGAGIGQALIASGLSRLSAAGAHGCVVLGEPGYYARFGFRAGQGPTYGGGALPWFQALAFTGPPPHGEVACHRAFIAS